MSPKSALLAAATVAVVGLGVYLFIQVRATPAQAEVTHNTTATVAPRPNQLTADTSESAATKPEAPPVPGSTRTSWERKAVIEKASASGDSTGTGGESDDRKVDMSSDSMMELANKAYDAQDFDQATAIAGKVLAKEPNNVRMLRIMVSANCIQGDSGLAQQHYERLPKFDREQMKTRCDRYGVSFKEPATEPQ